ncbi:MAG: glycosyltransferase family 39 protein [Phycisphaerae bacterium]|nr:glycosyltransferase family 39 protein [Phycisphaerae bacterium]
MECIAPTAHPLRDNLAGCTIVVLLGLGLFLPGIRWGLPALVSWSQDSIAGVRTLGAVETWPEHWRGRYPPLHYLLLSAAYRPVIAHWSSTGQRTQNPATGEWTLAEPQAPKIATLLLIARGVSVAMGILAGLGVYAVAFQLTRNVVVSTLSAAALMSGAAFTCFAHLGNVDVPSVCWIAWSAFFYVRLLQFHRLRNAAALGLLAALATCTKDSAAGIYPGMAVVLLLDCYRCHRARSPAMVAARRALLQWHWLVGLLCFVLPCLYINGAFHDFGQYVERLRYWIAPPEGSLHARQTRYDNPFVLMLATFREAGGAVGWPMVIATIAAVIHGLRHHRRVPTALLVPAVFYWLIVILPIRFVYDRFLFPPFVLLSVLVGIWLTDVCRGRWALSSIRLMVPVVVFLPTLACSIAIDLEMLHDSRYDAEAWFLENVPREASVGAFSMDDAPRLRPQYLPRVHELGYATYPVVMSPAWLSRPQPEFLILTSFNYEDFSDEQRKTMDDLLAGRYGYGVVARFGPRFLGTGSHWLSLPAWGAPTPGKISPTLIILKRRAEAQP